MNPRDPLRISALRDELIERIAAHIGRDGTVEAMAGLHLNRSSHPTDRAHGVSRPALCVIAQGRKEVYAGAARYPYDSGHYLLATVELPVTGRVVEASEAHPYLALRMELDPTVVGSVMVESGVPAPHDHREAKAIVVSALETDLLDAIVRLVRLLDSPEQARVLVPMVQREIIYRLLMGEQGGRLRQLPMLGSHSLRIAQAVDRLRKEFDRPLKIERVAKELGMSSSAFHQHFKAITDMSPLQFQKQLRLQEARRLMLGESLDAASAAFRVGYHDASQFSREYKRHFGQSPMRDLDGLRRTTATTGQN